MPFVPTLINPLKPPKHYKKTVSYMLALYIWTSMNAQAVLMALSSAPDPAKAAFPGLSDSDIVAQINLGPIVQLALTLVAMRLLSTKNGLSRSIRISSILSVISAAIRLALIYASDDVRASAGARVVLNFAAVTAGAAAPFVQGSPSRFSAIWFPPSRRVLATAAAYFGTSLGIALSYVLAPLLLPHDDDSLARLLWAHAILAAPPVVASFLYCPEKPVGCWWTEADSGASYGDLSVTAPISRARVMRELRGLACNRGFWLVALTGGIVHGPFQSWVAALPTLLDAGAPADADAGAARGWRRLDLIVAVSTAAYAVGTCALGALSDACCRGQHLKRMILGCHVSGVLCLGVLLAMLPGPWGEAPLCPQHAPCGDTLVCLVAAAAGFVIGGSLAPILELSAQLTHPIPEGVSGNLVSNLFIQLIGILYLTAFLDPRIASGATAALVACVTLTVALMLPVREVYTRANAEARVSTRITEVYEEARSRVNTIASFQNDELRASFQNEEVMRASRSRMRTSELVSRSVTPTSEIARNIFDSMGASERDSEVCDSAVSEGPAHEGENGGESENGSIACESAMSGDADSFRTVGTTVSESEDAV